MAINFPNNPSTNATYTVDGTTWIFTGTTWDLQSSGIDRPINNNNGFTFLRVSGQNLIEADSTDATLNFVAGNNITLSTDATTDTLTISAGIIDQEISNSFQTIAVSGQSSIQASSATDTLNISSGSGITITTNASTKTLTITNSKTINVTDIFELNQAEITVDQLYLPAITRLTVTNSGTSAYLFDQYSDSNPTVYAISGTTIAFELDIIGHPFLIQDVTGTNYNTGLIHVSTNGIVSTDSAAQGKETGTLYWKIPQSGSGNYRYQCQNHGAMIGLINVKQISLL